MLNRKLIVTIALIALVAVSPAFARVDFTPIEGAVGIILVDSSDDGTQWVASGVFGGGTWTYNRTDGLTLIGTDGCSGQARISPDGTSVVSNARDENGKCNAARWDGGQNWTTMGSEPGGLSCGQSLSSSYAYNGTTAVGLAWRAQLCKAIGGTWDVNSGMFAGILESTVENRPTRGNDITNDGNTVFGWQDAVFGTREAVRWDNGIQSHILSDNGLRNGEVIAANADGSAVVGTSYQVEGGFAWLWREGRGMVKFGVQNGVLNIQTVPTGVSADGNTVVGVIRNFAFFEQKAFMWTEKKGFVYIEDFLKGQSADGWALEAAAHITEDGNTISGWGFNPNGQAQGWIIDLKATGPRP